MASTTAMPTRHSGSLNASLVRVAEHVNYGIVISMKNVYRASHVLEDLGWVDLDLGCSTILLGQ